MLVACCPQNLRSSHTCTFILCQAPSDLAFGELSALRSVAKMDEVELLLHGLELGHLADIMVVSVRRRRLVGSHVFISLNVSRMSVFVFCFFFTLKAQFAASKEN